MWTGGSRGEPWFVDDMIVVGCARLLGGLFERMVRMFGLVGFFFFWKRALACCLEALQDGRNAVLLPRCASVSATICTGASEIRCHVRRCLGCCPALMRGVENENKSPGWMD